jgi:3-hydroxyisobutyrate dehydrogenase
MSLSFTKRGSVLWYFKQTFAGLRGVFLATTGGESAKTEGLGHKLGWIGTGRMGSAMVSRLLERGCDLAIYNRTRAKAEPFRQQGARIVDAPADLADRNIVFTSVSRSEDFADVLTGPNGLFSRGKGPALVVDTSTVSMDITAEVRAQALPLGTALLAAPVSGNPKVVRSGRLTIAASGPAAAFDTALPYLRVLAPSVTYVGEGERARLVKICHNLLLDVFTQALAETTVLAERGGIARADYLAFINGSVMGSTFSRYKTPSFVNLDFTPTMTGRLMRKDLELGLEVGRQLNVPLPVTALTHQIVVSLIGQGLGDSDFGALLELEARNASFEMVPDDRTVSDGL